jgi:hypothetical protein
VPRVPRPGDHGAHDGERLPLSLDAPTIVPILATPLGIVPLPDAEPLNGVVGELFESRAAAAHGRSGGGPLCYRSDDDLLEWPDEPVRRLTTEILRGTYAVVRAVNSLSEPQLQSLETQARIWYTLVRPDGCVPAARYPLTTWCAIYCVAAPEPATTRRDSGVLRLYESRLGTMFADATSANMRLPYALGHFTWRPAPGQLAVFPASVTHEIALNRSAGDLVLVTARVRFVGPGQSGLATW